MGVVKILPLWDLLVVHENYLIGFKIKETKAQLNIDFLRLRSFCVTLERG